MNAKHLLVASLALGGFAAAAVRADTVAGDAVFKSRCTNCHSLIPGLSTVAPDLTGVVGRKAGSLKGYQYSPALRNAGFVWTAEKLDQWLTSPHKAVAETEMAFPGLKSEKERGAVIEFLKHYAPKK